MEFKCHKGEHIILTDNCSQSYLGTVKSVNQKLGRIVLSDVVQLPDHKIITGYRNFDKNEIKEIRKYEENKPEGVTVEERKKFEKTDSLENKFSECKITGVKNDIIEYQNDIKEYHFISNFGNNFYSAIQTLKSCKKIGLLAKDTSKGRCSRASIIALSTPSVVFIFDLQTLGDEVLTKGLREILESSDIVKVVHDCRLLSDCLKHKHLINLEGVRDVEAEDIMVVFQQRKMIRKHRRSLEYLIKIYLGIDLVSFDEPENVWNERPLSCDLLKNMVSIISHLIPLQEAIEQKYTQRLINASTIYNSHVRSLDFFEFLHDDPVKTLRNQILKLILPQTQVRADCKEKKINLTLKEYEKE